jgi:hypothetical protein
MVLGEGRLPEIVVPLPQVAMGDRRRRLGFTSRFRKLANAQISCCNIRHNRI